MRIVAIIPARMAATRFPGKPLAPLLGLPMIEHVVRRVAMCHRLDATYVATCDDAIRSAMESVGVGVILTSAAHERASDRVAEAVEGLEADIVVMVQGDEPMIVPEMIDAAIAPIIEDPLVGCVNLMRRIESVDEYLDPNTIKVVTDTAGDALFFSRSPVPAMSGPDLARHAAYKQVCVIPFRRDALRAFARLAPTPLERAESIDMLRFLEHGRRVRMVETAYDTHAVDTPDDLVSVEQRMRRDPLVERYAGRGVTAMTGRA